MTTEIPTPEYLRRFAADRDPDAFAALVEAHYPMVLGIGYRVLGDPHEAEDIAQATFVLLAEKAPGLAKKSASELSRWIVASAYCFAKNRQRVLGNRRRKEAEFARLAETPEDHGIAETVATVDDAISKLPTPLRDVVIARYLRGLSYRETALELHVPVDTVRGRLARAKVMLKATLAGTGILASLSNAGAVPPPRFAERTLAAAKPIGGIAVLNGLLWKGAAILFVTVAGSWFFFVPHVPQQNAVALHTAESATPLALSTNKIKIPPRPDLVAEWDALIADRIGGPLGVSRREVPDEENGYFAMVRLYEAQIKFHETHGTEWKDRFFGIISGEVPWDPAFVAEALAAFEPLFAIVDEILAAPDFQFPVRSAFDRDTPIPFDVFTWYLQFRGRSQHQEGDFAGAIETCFQQLALNDRLAGGQGDLMSNLINNTIAASSQSLLIGLLENDSASIDRGSLERLNELFEFITPPDEATNLSFGVEYEYKLSMILKLLAGKVTEERFDSMGYITDKLPLRSHSKGAALRALFDTDLPALATWLDRERIWMANALGDLAEHPPSLFEDVFQNFPKDTSIEELNPVQLADYWAVVMTDGGSSLQVFVDRAASNLARQRLIQTRVAIELARRDGKQVNALTNLVPNYLPEVPLDPFSGRPLNYDRKGKKLISVGKDRIAGSDDIEIPVLGE